jgi:hypothetical protein
LNQAALNLAAAAVAANVRCGVILTSIEESSLIQQLHKDLILKTST